jgi:hypothetical protein
VSAASGSGCERDVTWRSLGLANAADQFFYGIAIWMYWNEGAHARPHFHARYQGAAASVDLAGEVIAGSLPSHPLTLVAEWAVLHHVELLANWERARPNEPLEPIEPLP